MGFHFGRTATHLDGGRTDREIQNQKSVHRGASTVTYPTQTFGCCEVEGCTKLLVYGCLYHTCHFFQASVRPQSFHSHSNTGLNVRTGNPGSYTNAYSKLSHFVFYQVYKKVKIKDYFYCLCRSFMNYLTLYQPMTHICFMSSISP